MDSLEFEKSAEALRNLTAEKPETRLLGARKLMRIDQATFAPIIVPALAGLLTNPDSVIILGTLRVLGKLGPASRQAGEAIFRLGKGDGQESKEAVEALRSIYGIPNIDKNQILGYDDYQSFLKHIPDSRRLPENHEDKRPKFLTDILSAVPEGGSYAEQTAKLEEFLGDVRRQVAGRLLPLLKAEMQAKPHETYDDKREIARWTNDELKRFDMAFVSPKTGEQAVFKVNTGNHPAIGSFELRAKTEDGRARTFTTPHLAVLLENLSLMDATPRREPLAEWHRQAKDSQGKPGRS